VDKKGYRKNDSGGERTRAAGERRVKNQSSLCSAAVESLRVPTPALEPFKRDRAPQPFNLCIANATLYLPRPSGPVRVAGQGEKQGRDCYFNEISLNAGTRGNGVDGWSGG